MQSKLKVKVIKYNKNLFYVVVGLNKRSIHSRFIDKLGVCFFRKKKKIIMLSLKKLSYWLNRGIKFSKLVSYLFSIIFFYYLNNKKKYLNFKNYTILQRKFSSIKITNKIKNYLKLKNEKKIN